MFLLKYALTGLIIVGFILFLKRKESISILQAPPALYQPSPSLVLLKDQPLFTLLEAIAEERALKLFYNINLTSLLKPQKNLSAKIHHNAVQFLKKSTCDFVLADKNHLSPQLILLVEKNPLEKEKKAAFRHLSNEENRLQSILQEAGLPFIFLPLKQNYTKQALVTLINQHLVR